MLSAILYSLVVKYHMLNGYMFIVRVHFLITLLLHFCNHKSFANIRNFLLSLMISNQARSTNNLQNRSYIRFYKGKRGHIFLQFKEENLCTKFYEFKFYQFDKSQHSDLILDNSITKCIQYNLNLMISVLNTFFS